MALALTLAPALRAQSPVRAPNGEIISTEGDPLPSGAAEAILGTEEGASGPGGGEGQAALSPRLPSLRVDKAFEAFDFDLNADLNGSYFIPPDPMGAAGKSRIIAVANTLIESRTKGGSLDWRLGLQDFFAPLAVEQFPFDPKIVYDQYEDRFVVVALQLRQATAASPGNVSRILLAVSKDGNPQSASDWHFAAIDSKVTQSFPFGDVEFFADYPGFEVDEEAIYITNNMFALPPFSGYLGVRLWIVGKGAGTGGFYDGGGASSPAYDPYADGGLATTTMPAQVYGEGGIAPGVGTYLVSYSGLSDGVVEFVQTVRVDDPLGTPTFTQEFTALGDIETTAFGLPDAPQAGTGVLLEVNDRRALDAVWRDGTLWMTSTILPTTGPDAGETTANWVKLNALGTGTIDLAQQGTIGGNDIALGAYTYFPSVAVNRDGAALFGFSASAPTLFGGAFVTGRVPADPPGTVRTPEVVHLGEAPYNRFFSGPRNRWGDYSGIAIDPTNDDFAWVFNEYAEQQGTVFSQYPTQDGRWGTAWARAKFTGGPPSAIKGRNASSTVAAETPFALEQNRPNPFASSTTLSFSLPEAGAVRLAVHDVLGREVAVVVHGEVDAGVHTETFSAASLPSGIYLVRLVSPQGTLTRTMQVVR